MASTVTLTSVRVVEGEQVEFAASVDDGAGHIVLVTKRFPGDTPGYLIEQALFDSAARQVAAQALYEAAVSLEGTQLVPDQFAPRPGVGWQVEGTQNADGSWLGVVTENGIPRGSVTGPDAATAVQRAQTFKNNYGAAPVIQALT